MDCVLKDRGKRDGVSHNSSVLERKLTVTSEGLFMDRVSTDNLMFLSLKGRQ